MIKLRYSVAGEVQYERMFQQLDAAAEDLTVPFTQIANDLRGAVDEQFDTEGAHAGIRWKPLSPGYRAWKAEHFPGMPILRRTGQLHDAFKTLDIGPQRLIWGVGEGDAYPDGTRLDVVAGAHQSGYLPHGLPARKMIALTAAERREWDRHIVTWLRQAQGTLV